MNCIEEIYQHCLQQPVHNHSVLHEYDLMEREGKKTIHYILLNDFGEAEIFPAGDSVPSFLPLYEWDYRSQPDEYGHFAARHLFNIPVTRCNGRFFIQHFALNPNFCLFVKCGNEDVNIYHNSLPGSALISYFDASEGSTPGCFLQGDTVEFRMWSPPAGRVQVLLFGKDQELIKTGCSMDLKRGDKGMWNGRFSLQDIPEAGNFEGLYYQYLVYAYGKVRIACDPWAWSLAAMDPASPDKMGKAAIIHRQKISPFSRTFRNSDLLTNTVDFSGYEAHIRDFTASDDFSDNERGTFNAFTRHLSNISALGFTHIQLMPVMKFYTINENDRSQYGVQNGYANYNWGYDAHHYFSPEGWYSSDPGDPYCRIRELQALAQQIHQHNMGLVYDVVYNHTYIAETLENYCPGWFYRQMPGHRISGHTGAGAGLESRLPMTRKLMIDSLKHYIIYYGADGFRFDLLSFTDHETIRQIRQEAGTCYHTEHPGNLLLHGEGWNFSDLPAGEACTKLNPPDATLEVSLFNDSMRDGLMGHLTGTGMLHGNTENAHLLISAVTASCKEFHPGPIPINHEAYYHPYCTYTTQPAQCLNFISIHDGFTLWDKINITQPLSRNEKIRRLCQAATVLFTTQGKLMWYGGEEFLRSKPAGDFDREPWRTHSSDFAEPFENVNRFHENSFGASDFTNMIRNNTPGSEPVVAYLCGLSEIRKKLGIPLASLQEIQSNIRFLNFNDETEKKTTHAPMLSFGDPAIPSLTLRFINGPAHATCYICGEVHPEGTDGNPPSNPFAVRFDAYGTGFITFTPKQMAQFHPGKWGTGYGIRIKLVNTPGQWDYIPYAYTTGGNNTLLPQAISEDFEIVVDLHETDAVCPAPVPALPFLAFTISKKQDGGLMQQILVAHNFSDEVLTICNYELSGKSLCILADSTTANIQGIESPFASLSPDGTLSVQPHTSVIALMR